MAKMARKKSCTGLYHVIHCTDFREASYCDNQYPLKHPPLLSLTHTCTRIFCCLWKKTCIAIRIISRMRRKMFFCTYSALLYEYFVPGLNSSSQEKSMESNSAYAEADKQLYFPIFKFRKIKVKRVIKGKLSLLTELEYRGRGKGLGQ